ncbi:MAG: MarR family winged helix-turn-helix transcriptional regulator [Paenibacillus sp.]|uniref:MarR family winged helix-turn-helix transcriptional regulator n=1 Tax=Paenibacillus TaxID=44249 RepID=UPI003B7880CA
MKYNQNIEDPLSKFSLHIFQIHGLLMRSGDIVTRPLHQSSARWQVLGRIGHGTPTVAKIARDMGLARQSVQRIADVLTDEGLTMYKDHPTDRRTKLLELTAKGEEVLEAIYTQYDEWNQYIMAHLDPKQLLEITNALGQVGKILEKEITQFSNKANE